MTRIFVILNPTSGRGAGALAEEALRAGLQAGGAEYELVKTTAPGEAIKLAQQAADAGDWDIIAAAGGDGTLNEVLNGLLRAQENNQGGGSNMPAPALGLIPIGRGNDFGFGAGVPASLDEAVRVLCRNQRHPIDALLVKGGDYPDGRYVGNGVGIGFDAVVGFEAAKLKGLTGFPSYIVAALKTIFLYFKAPQVHIETDTLTFDRSALMVSVMNGRRMGGGFMMAPEASMQDGWIDVCIARQVSKPAIFGLIPKFMEGTQVGHPAIQMLRTKTITVSALDGSALPAHADGETLCLAGKRLEIVLKPGAVEMVS